MFFHYHIDSRGETLARPLPRSELWARLPDLLP